MVKKARHRRWFTCLFLFMALFVLLNAGAASADGGTDAVKAVDPVKHPDNYSAVLYDNTNGLPTAEANDVNEQLCEGNEAELFVTVWLAVIELSTGKGVAANAGHEHPALRRTGSGYEMVIYRHSPAVATMEGLRFREHEFQMNPGDSLFVYTDGVAEATNAQDELFGSERTLAALNRDPGAGPETILSNVMDGINVFVAEAEQFDDITMLCFQYNGPDSKPDGNKEEQI